MGIVKTVILNKKASFEFLLLQTFTAGIILTGTEVKAIREGKASLSAVSYTHLTLPTSDLV